MSQDRNLVDDLDEEEKTLFQKIASRSETLQYKVSARLWLLQTIVEVEGTSYVVTWNYETLLEAESDTKIPMTITELTLV